jgi:hypothetical protein
MNTFPNDESQNEQRSLQMNLNADEQALQGRIFFFTLSSGGCPSEQILGYINELNAFLGKFWAYRPMANSLLSKGLPACSQQLESLIQKVQNNISINEFAYRSRYAFETAMGRPREPWRPW